ncbi:sensor histidine kinase [Enterococcus faecalis]|nr:ATP-binding protein [Enterococcus faecalis]
MPYQLVGDVAISRGKNPYLNDQANREGLESNRFYYLFHDILTFVVEKFEEDRQYPLKLYGDLTRKIKKEVVERHKQEVLANIVEHLDANKGKKEDEDAAKENNEDEDNTESNVENNEENENVEKTLTNDDVEEAISLVFKQDIDQKEINDILMSLSSSGVMVGTFAHEIQRVATNLETRNMHLRHSINRLFEKNPYSGKASLNPLPQIEKYETTDRLLSSWINVITNPVMKENMEKKNNNFSSILNRICQEWLPLLEEKKINLSFPTSEDAINFTISELDIYLIVNNFILNSASFFENWIGKREIRITLEEQNDNVILKMINNGPPLSSRYQNNPDQIFVAGVTSKTDKEKVEEKGTGLGLWILSEAVERNAGKRKVLDELLEGFGIQCIFDKNG